MLESFEKIPVQIYKNSTEGSNAVAAQIAALIKEKQAKKLPCVLGMATGTTPILLYKELVRLHKEEGLSFKNVVTINLDEYYPIEKSAYQSYWSFMHRHLFDLVDIDPKNIERHGRLEPGKMFLVNMNQGRIVNDEEIKEKILKFQ